MKISYLPQGTRKRGALPLLVQTTKKPNDQDSSQTSNVLGELEKKLKKMKKADVVEVKTEIVE